MCLTLLNECKRCCEMYLQMKRWIDAVLALVLLILLFPIMVGIGICIRLESKGPALFLQRRIGKDRHEFIILKFRTMHIHAPKDKPTHELQNADKHITNVGKFLRKYSLDELPQLWNILLGDMSFVGPRPALWNQFDLIEQRESFGANDIRPGLTGLAQVSSSVELPIPEKAAWDGYYVTRYSAWVDFMILCKTVVVVCRRG